jgi:hypothetical protein
METDKREISILTCDPYDEGEVFTLYGHAAFRVRDTAQGIDWVFNYGIFDFSRPYFAYRFARGETDYMLGVAEYAPYVSDYRLRGSGITEQALDLLPEERQALWEALLSNARPENRVYRYNFFFDNCATRLPALTEQYVRGTVSWHSRLTPATFRQHINNCTRHHPWLTFGCDLVLGAPTDRLATAREAVFLPVLLREELAEATVIRPDGERPLVSATYRIAGEEKEASADCLFTPLVCGWMLFVLVLVLTLLKRSARSAKMDIVLFGIAGLAGTVVFFMSFFSLHPCTFPNVSLLWLHPLHLLGAVLFGIGKGRWYHRLNFAVLSALPFVWFFSPQYVNPAFIPFAACLWLRSFIRL